MIPTFEEYTIEQRITILISLVISVVFLLGVVLGIVLGIVYFENMILDKMYNPLQETESRSCNTQTPTNTIYPFPINPSG